MVTLPSDVNVTSLLRALFFITLPLVGLWTEAFSVPIAQASTPSERLLVMAIKEEKSEPEAAKSSEETKLEEEASEIKSLVAILENPDDRTKFLDHLKALVEAKKNLDDVPQKLGPMGRFLEIINATTNIITHFISQSWHIAKHSPQYLVKLVEELKNPDLHHELLDLSKLVIIAVFIGLITLKTMDWLLQGFNTRFAIHGTQRVMLKHTLLIVQTCLSLLPVAGFYFGGVTGSQYFGQNQSSLFGVEYIMEALAFFVGVRRIAYILLAPSSSQDRYIRLNDSIALRFYKDVKRVTLLMVAGFIPLHIASLYGLPDDMYTPLSHMVGVISTLYIFIMIFKYQEPVAVWLKSDTENNSRRSLGLKEITDFAADIWHLPAILVAVGVYAAWALEGGKGFHAVMISSLYTLGIITGARLVTGFISRFLNRAAALRQTAPATLADTNSEHRTPHLEAVIHYITYMVSFMLLLQAWGVGVFDWINSPQGQFIIKHALASVVIILVALVGWEIVNLLIKEKLTPRVVEGQQVNPSARASTLLPLLRNTAKWVIIVMTGLLILAQLNFDVLTIIAGFSIVGLAVAMGSQKLAQDVVTGMFILMENSLEVEDVVSLGGVTGEIEAFTLRTIRLRNVSGEIHTVPYSGIGAVSNFSRDYTLCMVEVGVAHTEDVARVMGIFEQVGNEMQDDKELGPKISGPLKVIGVSKITDTATYIMAVIRTEPDPYHLVNQKFNRRLKIKFAQTGVEMPMVRQIRFEPSSLGRPKQATPEPTKKQTSLPPAGEGAPA